MIIEVNEQRHKHRESSHMAEYDVKDSGHHWEGGVEATWEAVKVGADGKLQLDDILQSQRRLRKYAC